jgi:hypothetical protein
MSTLRTLSVIYLLCASAFSVTIVFDRDPALEHATRYAVRVSLEAIRSRVARPAVHLAWEGANHLIGQIREALVEQDRAIATGRPVRIRVAPLYPPHAPIAPHRLAQAKPKPALPTLHATPSRPTAMLGPSELDRVSARLRENLTHEMFNRFRLFLYVSKANKGPWSQRLYVFRKDAGGKLDALYNWPASTGREKFEIAPNGTRQQSITPAGYYQLDPARMFRKHFSGQWREPMPYAMFFNWENHGYQTGLAIHAATQPEIAQLGSRASAGCIRIAPENAKLLFDLIRSQYRGLAPRFAFDHRTATMSNRGALMRDGAGNLQMAEGYRVLVFIENYGGEDVVAALF